MKRNLRKILQIVWFLLMCLVFWGCMDVPEEDDVLWFWGADKLLHFGAYTVLYVSTWFAFPGAFARVGIVVSLLGYGLLIEVLQGQSGYRSPELADMMANAAGLSFGCLLLLLLAKHSQILYRYRDVHGDTH